jgi:hypothetical protein
VAEHTGQSSQLFPVTTGRNAQFLATVARSTLVGNRFDLWGYESDDCRIHQHLQFQTVAVIVIFRAYMCSLVN